MLMRVNKNTSSTSKNVKYAVLSSGTVSSVWYDEDTSALSEAKRRNRITLTREKTMVIKPSDRFDA